MAIRGVNLGNWLVLEKWMGDSPLSAARAADDHSLIAELDERARAEALEAHYASYVTPKDFDFLLRAGITLCRVPVPYHVFGTAHHPACIHHLDNAFSWAKSRGIGLLLDLHTVPLSQNGFDNGGYVGICAWHRSPARVDLALDVLERLARRYAGHPALWGIEPLNEPASWPILFASLARYGKRGPQGWKRVRNVLRSRAIPMRQLRRFYGQFYERVRPIVGPEPQLVFHDRFDLHAWDSWSPNPADKNVWIDTHKYVCFADAHFAHHSLEEYLHMTEHMGSSIAKAARHHRIMVGEWCLANHARDLAKLDANTQRAWYRRFADAQLAAWDKGGGSCFWSLRVANKRRAGWSFEECVRRGWLDTGTPEPPQVQ